MQTGYFSAAWQDIKNSPGWFGKLLVLGLVSLIPIFGWIVILGYLYGWARDMAWGVHAPLPAHVFGNEDGRLYSRGFFAMVIGFVCSLIPWAVEVASTVATGDTLGMGWRYGGPIFGLASGFVGLAFFALSMAATFFSVLFCWVGSMRMSIYGRLAAGFQFGKIWSMVRHDFNGILRIFGMGVLLFFGMTLIFTILVTVLMMFCVMVGVFATGGSWSLGASHPGAAVLSAVFAVGGVAVVLALLVGFVSMVLSVFSVMLVARALGYWTRQFDVPAWRGQDDPMPFELAGAVPGGPANPGGPGQQPPYQQPPYQQPPTR